MYYSTINNYTYNLIYLPPILHYKQKYKKWKKVNKKDNGLSFKKF